MNTKYAVIACALVAAGVVPAAALAQDDPTRLQGADLRSALAQRYDAAVALGRDPAVVSANDPRHIWANEAKAQCGIALGYLASDTRDDDSIAKCTRAHTMMGRTAPSVPPIMTAPGNQR